MRIDFAFSFGNMFKELLECLMEDTQFLLPLWGSFAQFLHQQMSSENWLSVPSPHPTHHPIPITPTQYVVLNLELYLSFIGSL